MWAFPLVAALVALSFAAMLVRQFLGTRRPAAALWAVALAMYAAASFLMFLGVLGGWTSLEFRVYWLLGATLTVPFLAQGELYLLAPRRVTNVLLIVLLFGAGFAFARIRSAPVHPAELPTDLPLGKDVFGAGTAAHRLPQLYSIPAYVVLVAGAAWSAWRTRRRRDLRHRTFGTLAIVGGASIVAVGSGIGAGYGVVPLFSIALAVGVAVMFWGFLLASRSSPIPTDPDLVALRSTP